MPLLRLIVVAFVGIALACSSARAEDPATRIAKKHYVKGEKLFALGKFDKALDEYQQAFDAKPLPDFLYNIGQCYRNLGDLDQAIFSFKKYLQLSPNASDRDKVEKLIGELQEKLDEEQSKKIVPSPPPPQPEPHPQPHTPPPPVAHTPIYKTWWFWTGVAVVAVGGSVGIFEAAKGSPPGTDLGNINFGK
ncbi:MAG TPA: tetratricopeptide repeat protein [Kofleriaceae bacterium]|jgi:tetratricopeptide (TPR) repeat protein